MLKRGEGRKRKKNSSLVDKGGRVEITGIQDSVNAFDEQARGQGRRNKYH